MGVRFICSAATFALIALTGCGRTVQGENGRAVSMSQPSGLEELTVTFGQQPVVTSKVGQVLLIAPPDAGRRWHIDYASDILEAMTPPDQMQRAGKAWRFRSARAGETDVRITAIAEAGSPAPASLQFVVTIRVVP